MIFFFTELWVSLKFTPWFAKWNIHEYKELPLTEQSPTYDQHLLQFCQICPPIGLDCHQIGHRAKMNRKMISKTQICLMW